MIQVSPGSGSAISSTNLDDVIAKIEERLGYQFKEHEVVHTFGSAGTLTINGLTVHHIEPPEIADDKRVRIVLFKENLSTGWDCPRAETIMSFRHANDATLIKTVKDRCFSLSVLITWFCHNANPLNITVPIKPNALP